MGKSQHKKRKTPMSERGIVQRWLRGPDGGNKGFGFIERASGDRIFCHRSQITDGDALKVGTEVSFDARIDHSSGDKGEEKATNVRGGVCFAYAFVGNCKFGGCCSQSARMACNGGDQTRLRRP